MSIEDLAWAENLDNFERTFMQEIVPTKMHASIFITGGYLDTLSRFLIDVDGAEKVFLPRKATDSDGWTSLLMADQWTVQMSKAKQRKYRIVDPNGNITVKGSSYQILKPILEFHHEQEAITRLRTSGKNRIGIVFDGGGGNGSYQIGVWKYLHERGVDAEITGVSGASVGALNSLLFVLRDYDLADSLWRHIETKDFVPWDEALDRLIRGAFPLVAKGIEKSLFNNLTAQFSGNINPYSNPAFLLLKEYLKKTGSIRDKWLMSQDRLSRIIRENVSPDAVCNSNILTFSSICALRTLNPTALVGYQNKSLESFLTLQYKCWNSFFYKKWEEILEAVLASSAHPLIYDRKRINNVPYLDGGALDNSPHRPLMEAGFRHIIVVHLNPHAEARNVSNAEVYQRGQTLPIGDYSRLCKIYHIIPAQKLGKIFESSPEKANTLINVGYKDAAAQLGNPFLSSFAQS